jgi:hypothetical protein
MLRLKIFIGLIILGSTCVSFANSTCSHVDMTWISEQIPQLKKGEIFSKNEMEEVCEVILSLGADLIPLYAGKTFILSGDLFKDGQYITRNTMKRIKETRQKGKRQGFLKKHVGELETLTSLSFNPTRSDKSLLVITDPDCSHCKALLPELEMIAMEKKLALKIIIFPILGEKSQSMAIKAICGNISYEEYKNLKYEKNSKPAGCEKASTLLNKTTAFFGDAGLSFVPLVVEENGEWIVEGNDIHQLKLNLGLASDGDESGPDSACTVEESLSQ